MLNRPGLKESCSSSHQERFSCLTRAVNLTVACAIGACGMQLKKRYITLAAWLLMLPAHAFPRLVDASLQPLRAGAPNTTLTLNLDLPATVTSLTLTPIDHPEPLRLRRVEWRQSDRERVLLDAPASDVLTVVLPVDRLAGAGDLVLKTQRNPNHAGVYLYDVRAETITGEQLPVGVARLHVNERAEPLRLTR